MKEFRNRTAVVTGAGSGMGRSIALSLAGAGANVAVCDLDEVSARSVAVEVRQCGVSATAYKVDVAEFAEVQSLAHAVAAEFGSIDVLVNNAGVSNSQVAAWDTRPSDADWVMRVNWGGVLHGHLAFLPIMLAQGTEGHIVNTSSMLATFTSPSFAVYSASKAAVLSYSTCVRAELQALRKPIGVSVLIPGMVKTNIDQSTRFRPEPDPRPASERKFWGDYMPDGDRPKPMAEYDVIPLEEATHFFDAISPDEVGPLVVAGIRRNAEFISTHPTPSSQIVARASAIAGAFNLTGIGAARRTVPEHPRRDPRGD